MPDRDKDASRRDAAGDLPTSSRAARKVARAGAERAESTPFHGALHSDPPQDPFRKLFSASSQTFEF